MPKVSVIIPIYNMEKHLAQCLDSVLNQTLKDIEIICVDDCSTDNSLKILKEYALKDNRIKILKAFGKGAGAARNIGLESATGEYLLFLDSDDFITPDMCEITYNSAIEKNAEIVIYNVFHYNTVTKKTRIAKVINIPDELVGKVINRECNRDEFLTYFKNCAWNKLFERKFVLDNKIRFQELRRSNDLLFSKAAVMLANRIYCIPDRLLYYRTGNFNNLQSNNQKSFKDVSNALLELKNFLTKNNFYDDFKNSYKKFSIQQINHVLKTLETYPLAYYFCCRYLKKCVLESLGLNKSDINMISFLTVLKHLVYYKKKKYKEIYTCYIVLGFRFIIKNNPALNSCCATNVELWGGVNYKYFKLLMCIKKVEQANLFYLFCLLNFLIPDRQALNFHKEICLC